MVQEDLKFLYYKFYIELVKINKQINKMLAAKVITDTALKSTSSDLFWSSFFPDFPAFGLKTSFSPNAGKTGKNADQNKSEYRLFLRRVK